MTAPTCPSCKTAMEPGFIVDRGHGDTKRDQTWVEGAVEKSFWTGVRTKGRETYHVTTYRCDRCGYLASYAVTRDKA